MTLTQHTLDRAALVLVAGEDGLVEWSATKDRQQVADYLRAVADGIEDGTL